MPPLPIESPSFMTTPLWGISYFPSLLSTIKAWIEKVSIEQERKAMLISLTTTKFHLKNKITRKIENMRKSSLVIDCRQSIWQNQPEKT